MANPQHLAKLKEGVGAWHRWRVEEQVTPDLGGADLAGYRLLKVDFGQSDLRKATLTEGNLPYANFQEANLEHAHLSSARLNWANFASADLSKANLTGCQLYGANFSKAWLGGANLKNAVLGDTVFAATNLKNAEGLSFCRHASASIARLLDRCPIRHAAAGVPARLWLAG
jgi:uncharacterized protein YjbI with pentapeptide repeats